MLLHFTRVVNSGIYILAVLAVGMPLSLRAGIAGHKHCNYTIQNIPFQNSPTKPVTGQILDNKKNPVAGASIVVKGTKKGVTSDGEGRFTLADAPIKGNLVVSSAGFAAQDVPITAATGPINITLAEQASHLNEVVVVGYGTVQKKDLTGAVSQIKVTQLENENPANVQDALRGNVPGLQISQTNAAGAKGGGDLQVRGRSTITAGNTPLLVLDGVIYPGDLSDINPNDIATIDVLKDASSAAVFGAKSASGVILITTKRGTRAEPTITLNTNVGFGELAINEPPYDGPGFVAWRTDVMNSMNVNHKPYEFNDPAKLPSNITVDQWKAYQNSVGNPTDIWLTRLKLLAIERENYKKGKTIDWYNLMFQKWNVLNWNVLNCVVTVFVTRYSRPERKGHTYCEHCKNINPAIYNACKM